MGCNCGNKNRVTAAGVATIAGTHRVVVSDRQVYESSSATAADTVGLRFDGAGILRPPLADGTQPPMEFWDAKKNAWLPRVAEAG